MGILDDAIKEHLELKRQHGADDDELKKLEDEAFGAPERPGEPDSALDPFAEAPTAFMAQPDLAEPDDDGEAAAARPRPDIADLQEAPPAAPELDEEPPAEEQAPAIEQAIPEPEPDISAGPSTEEREAIAEQPTEMYDLGEELGGSEAPAPAEGEEEQDADDFFDEKRLSDELDQALEGGGPAEDEDEDELAEEDQEPPAEDREEEDVLEETPDFLEEAPEDDQLWFEQKPPKDFDFDD
jgi:hypothetical protein